MSLLDGGKRSSLPSMSWESVVDDEPADAPVDDDVAASTSSAQSSTASPAAAPPVPSPAPPASAPPVPSPAPPAPAASTTAAPPATPTSLASAPTPPPPPTSPAVPTPGTTASVEGAPAPRDRALAALQLDVPMFELSEDDNEPASPPRSSVRSASEDEPTATSDLPTIQEATPVPDLTAAEQAEVHASNSGEVAAVTDAAPITSQVAAVKVPPVADPAPAPASPMSLPSQQAAPAASSYVAPTSPAPVPEAPKPRKQRRGAGVGLFLTLLVLAGLVTAGIVFGRQYLFPDDWEDNARPYAESIEETRGVEFVEPVVVTAEAPAQYEQRMADQLLGSWEPDLAMWRSFGLASGSVTGDGLSDLVAGSSSAMYSIADGQVYHDSTLAGAELDARVTEALAVAALDQDYGWSVRQGVRALDDAAMTEASVRQQAAAILELSDFGAPLGEVDRSSLALLPPVLGYRVGAPDVFAALLTPPDPVADNPLLDLEVQGPGPIGNEQLELGPAPEVNVDAEIIRPAQAMERSFWYLALAGYLPGNMSYDTTRLIAQSSLTVTQEGGVVCSYATFAAASPDQDAILATVLEAWAANAPAEMNAAVAVLPVGTQLRTCDPGEGFDAMPRAGVAHELTMWRAGELVATQAVIDRRGTDAEIEAAVVTMRSSGAGDTLIGLSSTSSAGELADAVRSTLASIDAPAAAPSETGEPAASDAVTEE